VHAIDACVVGQVLGGSWELSGDGGCSEDTEGNHVHAESGGFFHDTGACETVGQSSGHNDAHSGLTEWVHQHIATDHRDSTKVGTKVEALVHVLGDGWQSQTTEPLR